MSYLDDFARLRVLEDEAEEVTKRLVARASEWYRIESGRTHFHTLEFSSLEGEFAYFFTPIRNDTISVKIPLSWFEV